MQKNQEFVVTVEDMSTEGMGIGHAEGMAVFIKDAVVGDTVRARAVKVKKNYAFARLMEILEPSPCRVEPVCPVAKRCGGCQLQAMSYPAQLAFKEKKIRDSLERIGGIKNPPMEPIIGMEEPFHYRNKAQYPVRQRADGRIVAGFYAERSHEVIDYRGCFLGPRVHEEVLDTVLQFMEREGISAYDETSGRGLVRHVLIRNGFSTGEILVCLVVNGEALPKADRLVDDLTKIPGMTSISISPNRENTNVIMGKEVKILWGEGYIRDWIGDVCFQISPLSFYQVNPVQTKKLYGQALEYAGLTGEETVWDLYCGIGTISLFLAKACKQVYGVEIVPQAIEDARRNAEINGIENARFFVGKAEEVLPEMYEKEGVYADVIVIDPPRKGCDGALLETILKMGPEKVVYVSCDPGTLARDVKVLVNGGYEVERVRGTDMFGSTYHVESIVLLSHKSPDSVINVKVEFGKGEGKVPLDAIAERAKKYQPKPKITYKMIREYVEKKYGFKVHTAYIAEVKRSLGLTMYDAPNATEELKQPRTRPPKEKVEAITEALKYFEVI